MAEYRKWTEEENKYLEGNYKSTNIGTLAVYLKRSKDSVKGQAKALGLQKARDVKIAKKKEAKVDNRLAKWCEDKAKIDSVAALQNVHEEGKLLIKMLNKCKKMPDCVKSTLDRFAKLTEKAEKVRQYEYGFRR